MRKWFGRCPQQYPVTDLGVGSHTAIDRNLCGESNNFHSVENEVFKRFLADAWLVSPPFGGRPNAGTGTVNCAGRRWRCSAGDIVIINVVKKQHFLSYFKIENSSIWILSDSRSAIQHLSNWHKMGDNTGVAILEKLKRLLSFREIHQQWVPLYINITGNEITDALAKDDAA
ncbi:RNase H domain-containing protein [Trichonephila clavipes]|nr:RNase H domain-containing protein [Trichonephila clavipes]